MNRIRYWLRAFSVQGTLLGTFMLMSFWLAGFIARHLGWEIMLWVPLVLAVVTAIGLDEAVQTAVDRAYLMGRKEAE